MATTNRGDPDLLRDLLDAFPAFVFVVDEDVRIREFNAAAGKLLGQDRHDILKRRGGEVLHCLHSIEVREGCGKAPFCRNCVVRNSVNEAFRGRPCARRRLKMELISEDRPKEINALITARPFTHQGDPLVLLVVEDIGEMVALQRIIPICARCKKVRNDEQYWIQVESYLKEHLDLDFSHGYCPECQRDELEKLERELQRKS